MTVSLRLSTELRVAGFKFPVPAAPGPHSLLSPQGPARAGAPPPSGYITVSLGRRRRAGPHCSTGP